MENFLSSNEVFTVDLTACISPADVVFELTHVLDDNKAFGKKIYLKMGKIDLSQAQLLSLKSIISSINSTLSYIECDSEMTIASAKSIEIETLDKEPQENIEEIKEKTPALTEQTKLDPIEEAKKYINMDILKENPVISDTPQVEPQLFEEKAENREEEIQETEEKIEEKAEEPQIVEETQDFEQNIDNFAPGTQDFQEEPKMAEEPEINELQDFEPQTSFKENSYTENTVNKEEELVDFAPKTTEDIFEEVEHVEEEKAEPQVQQSNSVLEGIQQSIEFDQLAQDSNVQENEVQEALEDIFATEKKLESVFDSKTEQTTIDLVEPLDNTYTEEDKEIEQMNVKYVKQTIRSGNVISSKGNLVIIGDCHPGSELHAAGDITVWGILGGIAHAGNKGNKKAKVRALKLNPIQLRIANMYTRRPDSLHTICVEKTATFTPEEARILNNEIVIYTMNEK